MRAWPAAFAAVLLAACATRGAQPPPPAAWSGEAFAIRACAGCHAVGRQGASANPRAPAFRDLAAARSNAELARSIGRISREGHVEMPPIYVTPDEQRSLVAYMRTLAARPI
jgi:mono/diheme cytochrome c family protein